MADQKLDARIHQGYDPDSEFSTSGRNFSAALFSDVTSRDDADINATNFSGRIMTASLPSAHVGETQNITSTEPDRIAGASPSSFQPYDAYTDQPAGLGGSALEAALFTTQSGSAPLADSASPQRQNLSRAPSAAGGDQSGAEPAQARMAGEGSGDATDRSTGTGGTNGNGGGTNGNGGGTNGNGGGTGGSGGTNGGTGSGGSGEAILQAPVIIANRTVSHEGEAAPLSISVAADSRSGVVTVVTIIGVPIGATLSSGTRNPDGSWTLSPDQLSGLVLTPEAHASGDITLTVSATSEYNGQTSTSRDTFLLTIEGEASTPSLHLQDAAGLEDTAIPLSIDAALLDTDGSEVLTITIRNVPAGASLSAGTLTGTGDWVLTADDLTGLTLTPPENFSGQILLSVIAVSSENGTQASLQLDLNVNVFGVADRPLLNVDDASGYENDPIPLTIDADVTDTDGSETLSILIAGVPAGATLSAGTDNGDGSWTLQKSQLPGLTLVPPAGYSGAIALTVLAAASENSTSAYQEAALNVNVLGRADTPTLSVSPANGDEDMAIPLVIDAALTDDDGSETLTIIVSGLPSGASLSAGTNNGDGSWTLSRDDLVNLKLIPPQDFSGSFQLAVTAISAEDGTTASASSTLDVNISGVVDVPYVSVSSSSGSEGNPVDLHIVAASGDSDGSETLQIIVSGVPAGATLSAGWDNGDGSWTLIPADLVNLQLFPPQNFSGSLNLGVVVTASENGQSLSTSVVTLNVAVSGQASPPALTVAPSAGDEDTAIAISITALPGTGDIAEVITVTISGVPTGAVLSAGRDNGDGSWTLAQVDLTGLTLKPPHDYSGTFQLSVTATATQDGTQATVTQQLSVAVNGVPDLPMLSVSDSGGTEDGTIPLDIRATLTDADGSETLSVLVSGVPTGATLSAGTYLGNGEWLLSGADIADLKITPPSGFSGVLTLSVSAISSENGQSVSTPAQTMDVTVEGVASTPILSVDPASGDEDTAIALTIAAALSDDDGSENLSVLISGVPAGALLSAGQDNGDGSWTLTPLQLSNLTITPPQNFSGNFSLAVTATSHENSTSSMVDTVLSVTVNPVADTPVLSVQPASGNEDTAIPLDIHAALTDTDGSETLTILISGVPTGAVLSAGQDNRNGSWTLSSSDLSGLTLTPPHYFSGDFALSITAIASENANGDTVSSPLNSLTVHVDPVASAPHLSVQAATGNEDTAIALSIDAQPFDPSGHETLSLTISGVPAGAALSAGNDNGDGSWTLTPAQLADITLSPPHDFSGRITLGVYLTSTDGTASATVMSLLNVDVAGAPDMPTLNVQASSGNEGFAIPIQIDAALTDTDGSETLSVTISGVPAGATLSAGTNNGNGSWTLTPAQLSGLTLAPAFGYSGTINLGVTASSFENGMTATTPVSFLPVTVNGQASAPILALADATGNEDTPIALTISAGLLDNDGSEILAVTISGVPSGAILSAGIDNGDGSWTLTAAQLSGLTLSPPQDYSGHFSLTVTAASFENGTTATTTMRLDVTVQGVPDMPTLSIQPATGSENTAIALNISAALTDLDGSETLSVTIRGLPAGSTLSAGHDNGDGSWTLSSAQLTGLSLNPPRDYSGHFSLTVSATASENGLSVTTATTALNVNVAGVAGAPTLALAAASGDEDSFIALTISTASTDLDGSETVTITVSGLPLGSVLSAGTDNGNGSWTLSSAQLSGLAFRPPSNFSGNLTLNVTATSSEDGTSASTSGHIAVHVEPVADRPILSVQAATGLEDGRIPLVIAAALTDIDGSETLSIVIHNLPSGASLSTGLNNGDGSWTLSPSQLAGLALIPAANWSGNAMLQVSAISTESNGHHAIANAPLTLTVLPQADAPLLSVRSVTGVEDTPIPLTISASLTDLDGSETLQIRISGVPSGASLSAGTSDGHGNWLLTQAQLVGLKLNPALDSDDDFVLSVTATATDSDGSTNSVSGSIPVTVLAKADIPAVSAFNVSGMKNTSVALNINGAVTDSDGSEHLTFLIGGMPDGFSLNQGSNNGDNSWTLTRSELTGLKIVSPYNFEGRLFLTAKSVAHDHDGSVAQSLPASFNVGIGNAGTGIQINLGLGIGVAGIGVGTGVGIGVNTGGLLDPGGVVVMEDATTPLQDASLLLTLASGIQTITFSGLPAGASLSAGVNLGGGSFRLTPGQLTGLNLILPPNSDQDFTLTATAKLAVLNVVLSTTVIHVIGVADLPTLSVGDVNGHEDASFIPVSILSALTDTDGSETLSFAIRGLPPGFTLSAGIDNGNGTWSLKAGEVIGLGMKPPANWSGDASFTVVAVSTEREGDSSIRTATARIHVEAAADAPVVEAHHFSGHENMPLHLDFGIALSDTDGSETISSVVISGLASQFSLTGATKNPDGSWNVDPAQLNNVHLVGPANYSGDTSFTVTATSRESSNGLTASSSATMSAHLEAVAQAPSLITHDITGTNHQPIHLNISAALADTDGSEHLSVIIQNVPDHFLFSSGLNNGNGSWSFHAEDLNDLSVTARSGFTGDVNLHVQAFAENVNHDIATTQSDFVLHVMSDA